MQQIRLKPKQLKLARRRPTGSILQPGPGRGDDLWKEGDYINFHSPVLMRQTFRLSILGGDEGVFL